MNVAKTALKYFKPYKKRFIIALLGMAVFTFVSVMPPLLLRYLMDEVVKPELWNRLVGTMILIFVVPITAEVLRFVNMRLVI